MNQTHQTAGSGSSAAGLIRQGEIGMNTATKKQAVVLSKSGLPVLPVKKISPEVIEAAKKKREEEAQVQEQQVNLAEERLRLKEENDRKILKEEFRRKQAIMKEIKNPRDQVEAAMFNEMRDFIKKHGRRQFFKYYLSAQAVTTGQNEAQKFIQKRPLIDQLKFNNMYDQSLAEKKRIWVGEEGKFKKSDVQEWFKVWDETQLYKNRNEVINHDKKASHHAV